MLTFEQRQNATVDRDWQRSSFSEKLGYESVFFLQLSEGRGDLVFLFPPWVSVSGGTILFAALQTAKAQRRHIVIYV